MRISPINNTYQNYNNSFKAKPAKSVISKITNKALLPTAICAYVMSPLLGAVNQPEKNITVQTKQDVNNNLNQYEQDFVMNDKEYTMSYVNSNIGFGENAVSDIYFTPKDSTAQTLRLERLIKYTYDDDNYVLNAEVSKDGSFTTDVIELPDEIGNELLDLYDGNTDLYVIPGLNTYTEVLCKLLD